MGELLRRNVRERYYDVTDWIDIRPDVNMAWSLWLVAMIALCAYYMPAGLFVLASAMAVAATSLLIAFSIAALAAYVILAGIYDALAVLDRRTGRAERPIGAPQQVR